jgi:hypothetical protein
MSFYTASKKAEDVKQGGSNYITGSGIYPINLLAAMVSKSDNGSESVDMYLDHNGQKQVLFGNVRVTNNDGSPNKIGSKVFNQLVIIAGLDAIGDPVEMELPIGKDQKLKMAAVLEDLCDIECLMRVQMEFGVYKDNITEKKNIKAFFRADKATAEEIVNGTDIGKGHESEMKYVDNVTYKDGLTPELVAAWISAQRPKGTGGDGTANSEAPAFGEKKRFGEGGE